MLARRCSRAHYMLWILPPGMVPFYLPLGSILRINSGTEEWLAGEERLSQHGGCRVWRSSKEPGPFGHQHQQHRHGPQRFPDRNSSLPPVPGVHVEFEAGMRGRSQERSPRPSE